MTLSAWRNAQAETKNIAVIAVAKTRGAASRKNPAALARKLNPISKYMEELTHRYKGVCPLVAARLRLGYVKTNKSAGRAATALDKRHTIICGSSQMIKSGGSIEPPVTIIPSSI